MSELMDTSHARRPLGKGVLLVPPMAWGMWRFKGADIANMLPGHHACPYDSEAKCGHC